MCIKRTVCTCGAAIGIQERQLVHSVNTCALKRDGKTVKVRNTKRKLGLTIRR